MYGQIGGGKSESDVIPFARVEKNTTDGGDQLDTGHKKEPRAVHAPGLSAGSCLSL